MKNGKTLIFFVLCCLFSCFKPRAVVTLGQIYGVYCAYFNNEDCIELTLDSIYIHTYVMDKRIVKDTSHYDFGFDSIQNIYSIRLYQFYSPNPLIVDERMDRVGELIVSSSREMAISLHSEAREFDYIRK
jgi:hypothetical protein